ncbi:Spo0J and IME4 domain-containing protein [Polaromonas eurypsychrophila]|uniref:S-adenosylmethionine-binding protein n=1 Tax=Polaromonas eurypsychrophila TaxID=1614635 RepID=A0A916WKR2_9BURK|nr:MT-A70 family methyltransferase [Polaromonas eurypsychrophila]GGB07075.1 S-adenosylmethionine-binding protein [Polaromonas eurypsychrophila]
MKQISKAVFGQKRAISAQKNTVVKAKSTRAAKGIQPAPKLALDPCCKEFPPMEHDDFNSLKESILRNGQLQPLLVWQGRVLDGRHRLKACADLGIQPHFEEVKCSYEEARSMAFAANINRRNLSVGQRALLAARLASRKPGQTKASRQIQPVLTQDDAAKLFAVSRDAVQRGCRLLAGGSKATVNAVHTGSMSLNEAVVAMDTHKTGLRAKTTDDERKALRVAAAVKERLGKEARHLRLVKQAATSAKNVALPTGSRYSIILADPPWSYGMAQDRAASRMIPHAHYPVMSVDAMLAELDVEGIAAKDAMLFMWCPAPLLPSGLELMAGWGFEFLTNWVWHKQGGTLNCGGGTATVNHELLLVGSRGSGVLIADKKARAPSVFTAPVTAHSAKPVVVHERLETLYPGVSRIELFSRSDRTGWTMFGNEASAASKKIA